MTESRDWPDEVRDAVMDALGRRYSDDYAQQTMYATDAVLKAIDGYVVSSRDVASVALEISGEGPRMVSSVWAAGLLVGLLEGKPRDGYATRTEEDLNALPDDTVIAAPDGTWALAGGYDEWMWDEDGKDVETHVRRWYFFGSDLSSDTDDLLRRHGHRYRIVES